MGGYLSVEYNGSLTDCCGIHDLLDTPGAVGGSITISNNDTGCDSQAEVETDCGDADNDGVSLNDGDCDDNDPDNFPGNTETCDGKDNDCDGLVDNEDDSLEDNTDPVANCQDVTVTLDATGNGSTTAAAVDDGSSDACGIASLGLDNASFTCNEVGSNNTVTLTVTDNNGNTGTCEATVTVEDATGPVANCQDVTVTLDASGNGSATAAAVDNGSSDACGIASLSLSQTSFNCSNVGGNPVVLTVTDDSGNTGTCNATVTVEDNVAPTALCQDVTVTLDASGNGSTTAAAVDDGSSDACGIASLSLSQTSFNCSNAGSNPVVLTVTDIYGTISTCDATVTVEDDIAPTITCPAPVVVGNDQGQCSAVITYTVTGSDNCSFTLSQTAGIASGEPFPVGLTTNEWEVTDASGSMANCSFTVTVNKTADPDLLWAYTVIGFDEVKMKTNTVQSGGVGVVNAGKSASLESGTMVTAANTFVKAPVLELNGGSQVGTYYPGQVSAGLLPVFQPNNSPCSNDLSIPNNSAPVTLNLACYGKVTVGKNVSVTFSGNASVTVKDLTLKENASVSFAQNTDLLIDKKLDSDKSVSISNSGNTVWIFVEDGVKIDEGSSVTVNIYTEKDLDVKKANNDPTYMTGLFIANKVDARENVFWNWDAGACPFTPLPLNLNVPSGPVASVPTNSGVGLELYPNPAGSEVNVRLHGLQSAATLTIHDQMGRLVWTGQASEGTSNLVVDLNDTVFGNGFYSVTVKSNDEILTRRLVIVKQ